MSLCDLKMIVTFTITLYSPTKTSVLTKWFCVPSRWPCDFHNDSVYSHNDFWTLSDAVCSYYNSLIFTMSMNNFQNDFCALTMFLCVLNDLENTVWYQQWFFVTPTTTFCAVALVWCLQNDFWMFTKTLHDLKDYVEPSQCFCVLSQWLPVPS